MNNLTTIDESIKQLDERLDDKSFNWNDQRGRLEELLVNGVDCDRSFAIELIESHFSNNKDIRVLDYGCGSGIFVILMSLKGYLEVHGVDVVEKFNNQVLLKLGFNNGSFILVDDKLPFMGDYFDVISSSLVLEHVKDIELYYRESARVLKSGGVCFFNFPHRLKPYDSHSRTWFVHYFPKVIRKKFYDIFARQGGEYMNDYLYLRTISYHKIIAKKYFRVVEVRTGQRIKNINFTHYKGNLKIRLAAHYLMNLRYVGNLFVKIFSINSSVDLYLKK